MWKLHGRENSTFQVLGWKPLHQSDWSIWWCKKRQNVFENKHLIFKRKVWKMIYLRSSYWELPTNFEHLAQCTLMQIWKRQTSLQSIKIRRLSLRTSVGWNRLMRFTSCDESHKKETFRTFRKKRRESSMIQKNKIK